MKASVALQMALRLDSKTAQKVFASRNLLTADLVGEEVVITLQGDGNTVDMERADGSAVVDEATGEVVRKRIHNAKFNSELAIQAAPNKALLNEAVAAEKAGETDKAHELFNKYLNKVQLSFSIPSSSKHFGTLRDNQRIKGIVQRVDTENGSLLTIDPKSIVLIEAVKVFSKSTMLLPTEETAAPVTPSMAQAEAVA
jgi:hypothetical protein